MRQITLWATVTETGKYYFDVPDDVTYEEFVKQPWEYHSEFKSVCVDEQRIDFGDAKEFWEEEEDA